MLVGLSQKELCTNEALAQCHIFWNISITWMNSFTQVNKGNIHECMPEKYS